MKPAHVCFNCGEPTEIVVAKVSGKQHKKYICLAEKCWAAWRKASET